VHVSLKSSRVYVGRLFRLLISTELPPFYHDFPLFSTAFPSFATVTAFSLLRHRCRFWDCIGTVLALFWSCFGLFWHCFGTVFTLFLGPTVLRIHTGNYVCKRAQHAHKHDCTHTCTNTHDTYIFTHTQTYIHTHTRTQHMHAYSRSHWAHAHIDTSTKKTRKIYTRICALRACGSHGHIHFF